LILPICYLLGSYSWKFQKEESLELDSFAVKDMIITDLAAVISSETKGHPFVIGRNALFYSETKN